MSIADNATLYSLLGTQYGGDGKTSFHLPDLRGRAPISLSDDPQVGLSGGEETVTLTVGQMPPHTHDVMSVAKPAEETGAQDAFFAETPGPHNLYAGAGGTLIGLAADTVSTEGGGGAHNNMQPSLVLNFCICTSGLYPSRA